MSAPRADRTFLFLHLVKTGGSSMLAHLELNFDPGAIYPDLSVAPADGSFEYGSMERLRTVGLAGRDRLRVYAGHFPYLAVDLVEPDITFTVLREPVARAVSLLRQWQAAEGPSGRSLEAIYDEGLARWTAIQDYQARQFALTADELSDSGALIDRFFPADRPGADVAHLVYVAMDDERLGRALSNLGSVDVVGLQSRYDEFLRELSQRFDWRLPTWVRRRVAATDEPVPDALRRRIEADNAYEVEFYARAVEMVDRRVTANR